MGLVASVEHAVHRGQQASATRTEDPSGCDQGLAGACAQWRQGAPGEGVARTVGQAAAAARGATVRAGLASWSTRCRAERRVLPGAFAERVDWFHNFFSYSKLPG
jgi:hypothetical protein